MTAATLDFQLKRQLKNVCWKLLIPQRQFGSLLREAGNDEDAMPGWPAAVPQTSVDLSTSLTYTLEKSNISHLGRRSKIFKSAFQRWYVSRQEAIHKGFKVCESFRKDGSHVKVGAQEFRQRDEASTLSKELLWGLSGKLWDTHVSLLQTFIHHHSGWTCVCFFVFDLGSFWKIAMNDCPRITFMNTQGWTKKSFQAPWVSCSKIQTHQKGHIKNPGLPHTNTHTFHTFFATFLGQMGNFFHKVDRH